jgi:hypothetical protein
MINKPLNEVPLPVLHAARQACAILLADQHRPYLDGLAPVMLSKLRDDVGEHLGSPRLGTPRPAAPRRIRQATGPQVTTMAEALSTLVGKCADIIDDPELAAFLASFLAALRTEEYNRDSATATTPRGAS